MADNNRNWGGYRSSNQDWDDNNNRYGNDDDRNYSRGRFEGGQGYDWGRSGQDYGQGSSYGESRYDRDRDDRNQGYGGSNYGGQSNYDRDYSNYGSSSERSGRRSERGNVGAGFGFGESGSFRSRYDRERQSYSPGGYQNYGGGSGYGGNQWTGGYGGSSYGRNLGNSYGSGYGSSDYSSGGYGGGLNESFGRGEGGSGYGDRNYGGSYGERYGDRGYGGRSYDRDRGRNEERGWWDRTADEVSSWFGDEEAERRRRMDKMHKGRGPKNYQRSDERIKEDINDRLSDDWFVDASDIDVSVQSGEVTLTGTVDERTSKRRAEDIAESVSGVKHVENRLRVSSNQNMYSGSDANRSYGTGASTSNTGAATGTTGMGASGSTATSRSKTSVSDNK